jgi:hypothetical protein
MEGDGMLSERISMARLAVADVLTGCRPAGQNATLTSK